MDPSTTIIAAVTAALNVLFRLFRGGVPRNVKDALEGMRDVQVEMANLFMSFATRLARTVGRLLRAVHGLWVSIIEPALIRIDKIALRIGRILDRILRPYLEFLDNLRRQILYLYERFFRPVVLAIETVRRITRTLALLRVPFARQLDERLARLEQKILDPLFVLLRRTNELTGYLGVILTARWILQRPLFSNTLHSYMGSMVNMWWNAQTTGPDPQVTARLKVASPPGDPRAEVARMRQALDTGAGPLAADLAQARRDLEALLALS